MFGGEGVGFAGGLSAAGGIGCVHVPGVFGFIVESCDGAGFGAVGAGAAVAADVWAGFDGPVEGVSVGVFDEDAELGDIFINTRCSI